MNQKVLVVLNVKVVESNFDVCNILLLNVLKYNKQLNLNVSKCLVESV